MPKNARDRLVVTTDGKRCVRVTFEELRCSKTLWARAVRRSRPLQLCPQVCDCTDAECTFVHPKDAATFIGWQFRPVHANVVYKTLDDVIYPRFTQDGIVRVSSPDSKEQLPDCPINRVLVTKGAAHITPGARIIHCAHFFFENACHRAEECGFAHVVTIHGFNALPGRLHWSEKKVIERSRPAKAKPVEAVPAIDEAVPCEPMPLTGSIDFAEGAPPQRDSTGVFDPESAPEPQSQFADEEPEWEWDLCGLSDVAVSWETQDSNASTIAPAPPRPSGFATPPPPTMPAPGALLAMPPRTFWAPELDNVQVPSVFDPPHNPHAQRDKLQVRIDVGSDGVAELLVTEVS